MWPKEYIELKHIEDLLVCGICYEYMETPVLTSCSHNYCSLCIRKYLHYKTQCPTCFAETFEKDLRKNKVLDEVIALFLKIKDKLKRCLQIQIQFTQSNKDDVIINSSKSVVENEQVHLNKQENKIIDKNVVAISNLSSSTNMQKELCSPSTSGRTRIPLIFTPKSTKRPIVANAEEVKVVICPVCKVTVSEVHINKHLDDCLKREATKNQPQMIGSKRKPLPKLVFRLMKEVELRKKLKEFGLSSQGDRRACEARLQRYVVLYNAECDKSNPRPLSELLKQCEDEENVEKKINKTSSFINKLQINRNAEQNVIDDERKKYLETYKDSFESLIRQIKSVNTPKKTSIRRNLLNESIENNENIPQVIAESSDDSMNGTDKNRSVNLGEHVPDSDSDTSCPLQMYSSTDPKKFLSLELSPSISNNTKSEIINVEKDDSNSDALTDISMCNAEVLSINDNVFDETMLKTDSQKACNISKYKVLLERKDKLFLNDEMKGMNSVTTNKRDISSSNSDQEEVEDKKSSSVLHLSNSDSINTKRRSHTTDGFLSNNVVSSSSLEKENANSSPECSGKRSLRKRSRDFVQNDIILSDMKKIKSSQCYLSETDEAYNEESRSPLNNDSKKHLQNKSRLRKRLLNTNMTENSSSLRKSVRMRHKNNII